MEKNRIHTQPYGNRIRMSFAREKEVLEMPNLLDVQKDSYNWFIDEIGLKENLSPTRANGLASMIATIRAVAAQNV